MARKLRRAFFFCMMKCWLAEWLDFLFPEPVEQDMDGDIVPDIPETAPDSGSYLKARDIQGDISVDIPDFYKAEPLVQEAERVVRSRR